MDKIKIDVKQASEFMKLGYEIECHVLMPKVLAGSKRERIPRLFISEDTKFRVSLDQEGPSKGTYLVAWNKLKERLWVNGDITEYHTRAEIEVAIKAVNPNLDHGFFMYLVNRAKCLKVVE